MATYSGGEAILNVFTATANYTVPSGRYAKITVQTAIVSSSSSISIGSSVWSIGGGGASVKLFPISVSSSAGSGNELMVSAPEFLIGSNETIVLNGGSTMTFTVREFNNP